MNLKVKSFFLTGERQRLSVFLTYISYDISYRCLIKDLTCSNNTFLLINCNMTFDSCTLMSIDYYVQYEFCKDYCMNYGSLIIEIVMLYESQLYYNLDEYISLELPKNYSRSKELQNLCNVRLLSYIISHCLELDSKKN